MYNYEHTTPPLQHTPVRSNMCDGETLQPVYWCMAKPMAHS